MGIERNRPDIKREVILLRARIQEALHAVRIDAPTTTAAAGRCLPGNSDATTAVLINDTASMCRMDLGRSLRMDMNSDIRELVQLLNSTKKDDVVKQGIKDFAKTYFGYLAVLPA